MVNEVRPTDIAPEERERLEAEEKARAEESERARTLDVKEEDIVGDIDFPFRDTKVPEVEVPEVEVPEVKVPEIKPTDIPSEVEEEFEAEREVVAEREADRIERERLDEISKLEKQIEIGLEVPPEDVIATTKAIKETVSKLRKEINPERVKKLIREYDTKVAAIRFTEQQFRAKKKKFEAEHTELGAGQWMKNADLADIKKENPELASIALDKGYDAYINEIGRINELSRSELASLTLTRVALQRHIDDQGSIDVSGAINGGFSPKWLQDNLGLTDKEIEDFAWFAKFENASFPEKIKLSAEKDPATFAKNLGIGMIPGYGTAKFWQGASFNERGLMVLGDILFFVPITAGISAGVKGGLSLQRTLMATARGILASPYTALRHPAQTIKTVTSPIGVVLKSKKIPLASIWRGEYSPMSVMKVGAGQYPRATRDAMAELVRLAAEGKPATTIIKETGEVLSYSPTGLQKTLGTSTVHSTPFGADVAGKGFKAESTLFTSPTGSYKLTKGSATGGTAKYIIKGKDIVGDLGEFGRVIDKKGLIIGNIKEGTKVIGTDGKILGLLDKEGFVIADGKRIGKLQAGGIAVTLGKKPRTIGWLSEKAKAVSKVDPKIVIGNAKSLPTMAVIRSAGVTELPQWILDAKNMKQMEKLAEQALEANKLDPNLFPLYKQYKRFIEQEAIYPKGTLLIPVLDKNGKPIIMTATGVGGEKIHIPLLQEVSPDWFTKSLAFTKSVQGIEVGKVKSVNAGVVRTIPKSAGKPVTEWLKRNNKVATVYGSYGEYIQVGKKLPNDIDIAVPNPSLSARELSKIISDASGVQTRVVKTPRGGIAVQTFERGIWSTAIDLHPKSVLKTLRFGLEASPEVIIDGVRMESLSTQMSRLLSKSVDDWGEAPLRLRQVGKRLGVDVDIGIGAKAPSFRQLQTLKIKGIKNTVRDIFKKGLTKAEREELLKTIAPDLVDDFKKLTSIEAQRVKAINDIIKIFGDEFADIIRLIGKKNLKNFLATIKGQPNIVPKLIAFLKKSRDPKIINALKRAKTNARIKNLANEAKGINRKFRGYENVLIKSLRKDLRARSAVMSKILLTLPARLKTEDVERQYAKLREVSPITERKPSSRLPRTPAKPPVFKVERIPTITKPRAPIAVEEPERPPVPKPRRRIVDEEEPPPVPKPRRRIKDEEEEPPPVPRPARILLPSIKVKEVKAEKEIRKGAIAWRQGLFWIVVNHPYKTAEDAFYLRQDNPPEGAEVVKGIGSAYKTIQRLTGKAPDQLVLDMGIMDITITSPAKPGTAGTIKYTRDKKQRTVSDINLKLTGVRR